MRVIGAARAASSLVLLAVLSAAPVAGQERTDSVALSLTDALSLAMERSEEVRVAQQQVRSASAQVRTARSSLLPQVNTQVGYTKTLRSVFQGADIEIPDSLRFEPDSTASLQERIAYLERNTPNAAMGALGGLFSDLPFGRENAWTAAATLNQPLFSGGRIISGVQAARHAETAAEASLTEARADVALQVRETYYGALLADEAEEIVEASVGLAEEHLDRVRLLLETGQASELDAMRAEVELENLRPQLVQARNARELALLNLKRLVNLPIDAPVSLTTDLAAADPALPDPADVLLPSLAEAEPQLERRAAIAGAEQQVEIRREQVDIARGAYLPSVNLQANLSRQAFPSGFVPSEWQDDWTVGFVVQWPLFQGLRRGAEVDAAQAQVRQAELQVDQLREGVRLEYEQALGELEQARAQIAAATRNVTQATRVYELTELRYSEGLATQLDVSDARLALQQARMNEANAYHDFYLALARAERALGVTLIDVR
ncbi:MAG TPA: TolC family protein [Longimicrobiales bacterium]|nr:TolC family protein [Longimicrobiales bacterium]